MSAAELIERLRDFAKETCQDQVAENGVTLTWQDSVIAAAANRIETLEAQYCSVLEQNVFLEGDAEAHATRIASLEADLAAAREALTDCRKGFGDRMADWLNDKIDPALKGTEHDRD